MRIGGGERREREWEVWRKPSRCIGYTCSTTKMLEDKSLHIQGKPVLTVVVLLGMMVLFDW